jgi:small GTP-binding protein
VSGLRRNRALEEVAVQYKKQAVAKKTADEALKRLREQCAKLEEELKRHTGQAAAVMASDAGDVSAALHQEADYLRMSNKDILDTLDDLAPSEPRSKRASEEKKRQPGLFDGTQAPVSFKVVMIGASSVGKTSLAHYFVNGSSCIEQAPTHGAKFEQLTWQLKGKPITLELWDTSGQDRQMTTLAPYVRGADAVLLVFDCTSLASIQDLEKRFTLLMPSLRVRHPPVVFLLANKVDRALVDKGEVWTEEGEEQRVPKVSKVVLEAALENLVKGVHQQLFSAVKALGGEPEQGLVSCFTCSAKTGLNCKEIVEQLQLRIAFRQLYLTRTGLDVDSNGGAKIVKLGHSRSATEDKSALCCR